MSKKYLCSWDGRIGQLLSNEVKFNFTEHFDIPGINYDYLYYESETGNVFKVIENKRIELTTDEIEAVKSFCDTFADTQDYPVWTYDPSYLYVGEMLKSEAINQKLDYVLIGAPDHPASRLTGTGTDLFEDQSNSWEKIKMVIMEDGRMIIDPPNLCTKCVIGLTEEQYQAWPSIPGPYHTWDFITETWMDKRDTKDVWKSAVTSIRNACDVMRWKMIGQYIPTFEVDSWRHQLEEAQGYQQSDVYPTPYLDLFLKSRKVGKIPTKDELVDDILYRHLKEKEALAIVNAKQWDYFALIDEALNLNDKNEIDRIREECDNELQLLTLKRGS